MTIELNHYFTGPNESDNTAITLTITSSGTYAYRAGYGARAAIAIATNATNTNFKLTNYFNTVTHYQGDFSRLGGGGTTVSPSDISLGNYFISDYDDRGFQVQIPSTPTAPVYVAIVFFDPVQTQWLV